MLILWRAAHALTEGIIPNPLEKSANDSTIIYMFWISLRNIFKPPMTSTLAQTYVLAVYQAPKYLMAVVFPPRHTRSFPSALQVIDYQMERGKTPIQNQWQLITKYSCTGLVHYRLIHRCEFGRALGR